MTVDLIQPVAIDDQPLPSLTDTESSTTPTMASPRPSTSTHASYLVINTTLDPSAPHHPPSLLIKTDTESSTSCSRPSTGSHTSSLVINTATVRFAPLPTVSPTRRKPTRPMGVAGRAVQVRRRKAGHPPHQTYRDHELTDYRHQTDYWEDDGEGGRRPSAAVRRSGGGYHHRDVEAIDPFLLLGKFVRKAGTGLWKRVAKGRKEPRSDNNAMAATAAILVSSEAVAAAADDNDVRRSAEPEIQKMSETRRMEDETMTGTLVEGAMASDDSTYPCHDTLEDVVD